MALGYEHMWERLDPEQRVQVQPGQLPYSPAVSALEARWPLLGIALRHHKTPRASAISFRNMPFLVELYRDLPTIDGCDVQKAVQTGISELLVQFTLMRAGWDGRTVAYVLPTARNRDKFVQTRIDSTVLQVPAYRARLPGEEHGSEDGADSMKLKRFGRGTMMFLGSNTPAEFVEFSTDVLIIDEVDRCTAPNIELARDRLRASPTPQLFRVGNPTIPGVGISLLYDEGDRRKWHYRCGRCGERQPMDWFVNFVDRDDNGRWRLMDRRPESDGDARPMCRRCRRPFEREPTGGQWVRYRTNVARRSYHNSRLDILNESTRALFLEWEKAQGHSSRLVVFHNSVLGLGYEPEGMKLTEEAITRLATGPEIRGRQAAPVPGTVMTAGVDVGGVNNVVISSCIGDRRDAVYVGAPRTFAEVRRLLKAWGVRCAVVDARPEGRMAQKLQQACQADGITVWLCNFHPADKITAEPMGLRLDWKSRVALADKTQAMDASTDDVLADPPRRSFPRDIATVPEFLAQMRAPTRVLMETPSGPRFVWSEGNDPDHYRLADTYDRIALYLATRGGTLFTASQHSERRGDDRDEDAMVDLDDEGGGGVVQEPVNPLRRRRG